MYQNYAIWIFLICHLLIHILLSNWSPWISSVKGAVAQQHECFTVSRDIRGSQLAILEQLADNVAVRYYYD